MGAGIPEELIDSDLRPIQPGEKIVPASITYRDDRAKRHCDEQLKLYKPCSCGSGKKYKWCCKINPKEVFTLNTDAG